MMTGSGWFRYFAMAVTAGLLGVAPRAALASCNPTAGLRPAVIPASFQPAAVAPFNVRISYLGHSSFEIETVEGIRAVTDYNSYVTSERLPNLVTMNNAADRHSTDALPAGIKYVLRGWDPQGGMARHNVSLRDLRVRSVPTNLADIGNGKFANGNSIFVFESAGLCIAHFGQLRHVLSPAQVSDLGRVDIVFVSIDGMWTMSHDELFEVLDQVKPMLIIPMQFGSFGGVEAFVARAEKRWKIRRHTSDTIEMSFRNLPRRTEVLFLRGE
jgi:L-ascorbate metabolism protein UlaG (beta-lactamase superfamily)